MIKASQLHVPHFLRFRIRVLPVFALEHLLRPLFLLLGAPSPRSLRWNFEISVTGAVTRHGVINWEELGEIFWWVVLHSQWSTKMPRKFRPKFRPIFCPILCPEFRPVIKICRHNFALGNVRRNFWGWEGPFRIFCIFPVSGSNRWFRKSVPPALLWPASADRDAKVSGQEKLSQVISQTGGFPILFGKVPGCVLDLSGSVPRRWLGPFTFIGQERGRREGQIGKIT